MTDRNTKLVQANDEPVVHVIGNYTNTPILAPPGLLESPGAAPGSPSGGSGGGGGGGGGGGLGTIGVDNFYLPNWGQGTAKAVFSDFPANTNPVGASFSWQYGNDVINGSFGSNYSSLINRYNFSDGSSIAGAWGYDQGKITCSIAGSGQIFDKLNATATLDCNNPSKIHVDYNVPGSTTTLTLEIDTSGKAEVTQSTEIYRDDRFHVTYRSGLVGDGGKDSSIVIGTNGAPWSGPPYGEGYSFGFTRTPSGWSFGFGYRKNLP